MRRSALVLAASLASASALHSQDARPVPAPVRADTARLHRQLDSIADAHHGVVSYAVRNLDTGERLARRGDEPFPTASLIKVPILVTLFDLVEKKRIALDDRIILTGIDKVPGAGNLQFMHDGIELTVRDAAWLMITISDNTATNLLLDKVAIRRVWEAMEARGLPRTKVHAKSFQRFTSVAMDSSVKYGLGVSTANEMAQLFTLLANGKAVSSAADSTMLDFLDHNTDGELLQRWAGGVPAAHKTGAVDAARTECSYWRLPARIVACVFTRENVDQRWVLDSEPQLTMAALGRAIVEAWRPAKP
ncbi:MAG: class A beta-lactamase-related serine hydrolase [Gemmatimonadaceae bacterium]|nr:class A beta-lactamase-related serine hydrolase [Gemmatimonadaceae bacterium]